MFRLGPFAGFEGVSTSLNYATLRAEITAAVMPTIPVLKRDMAKVLIDVVLASIPTSTYKAGVEKSGEGLAAFTAWYKANIVKILTAATSEITADQALKGAALVYPVFKKYYVGTAAPATVAATAVPASTTWWDDETVAMVKAVAAQQPKPVTVTAGKVTPATTPSTTSNTVAILAVAAVAALFLMR